MYEHCRFNMTSKKFHQPTSRIMPYLSYLALPLVSYLPSRIMPYLSYHALPVVSYLTSRIMPYISHLALPLVSGLTSRILQKRICFWSSSSSSSSSGSTNMSLRICSNMLVSAITQKHTRLCNHSRLMPFSAIT